MLTLAIDSARKTATSAAAFALTLVLCSVAQAQVDLADKPLFSTTQVPGNLALALSVEWPTATTAAYPAGTAYSSARDYMGYFDPTKCYQYAYDMATPANSYFNPVGAAVARQCTTTAASPLWSGNYMNWASMQSLDVFRWVLTGGYRSTDDVTVTHLTKTFSARNHASAGNKNLTGSATVQGATPFSGTSTLNTRIQNLGTRMYVTATGNLTTPAAVTPYQTQSHLGAGANLATNAAVYELYINVRVCTAAAASGPWKDRCIAYGGNYKPEGLMQQYAQKLRYSAFGYLNDSAVTRDGGVLRARMKSIGPLKPVPGAAGTANANTEWSSTTGVMIVNPDTTDSSQTATDSGVTVANSGVMNYLNKFGYSAQNYKDYDPVGEMYYAVTRYFRNQGNVASYSNLSGATSGSATMATWVDGFPVIRQWDDPIQYSCQKNFVLGIGDIYTHRDRNLPGSTITSGDELAMPSEVVADVAVNVTTANAMVGQLEGIANLGTYSSGRNNSFYMAGLAYDAHTKDIRADLSNNRGIQTINTYWLDVLEAAYVSKNQYWLAAKYGGFTVPTGFNPDAASNGTTTLAQSTWNANATDVVGADPRPENYFLANNPERMKAALEQTFEKIEAENGESSSTAFSTAAPKLSTAGAATYSASYTPRGWIGELTALSVNFDADGVPTLTERWNAQTRLDATSPTNRKIVTRCSTSSAAIPFRPTDLTACSAAASAFGNVPNVGTVESAANFVNFLRGDRSREKTFGGAFRNRTSALGDIVGSKANPVGRPIAPYREEFNSGYSAFKIAQKDRKTVVYVGANDGMMHAFDGTMPGATACATCGTELFAYIPSFVHSALPNLGDPSTFAHRYYVDATPQTFDVDFRNTQGATATTDDWRTIVIGGLGKGGNGYYALDVTDPNSWTSETAVAGKTLWEFTDPRMGYTYGDASVVKTKKYGWVVLLSSGYNNSNGRGYVFLVNPRTGALLEAIATPAAEPGPINLARLSAYIEDYGNYTADAVYAGDLQGNVWRFNLTGTTGSYPAPTKIAVLTSAATSGVGAPQPVTVRPMIEVDPASKKRYVVVATGRLLADSDIASSQIQSLYVIADGDAEFGAFYTSTTLPSGQTFPIARADLNLNTNVLVGIGSSPAQPMGWVMDFGAASNGIAERADVTMTAERGAIVVPVNLPNGEPCDPGGAGRVFSLGLADGKTVLEQQSTNVAGVTTSTPIESFAAGGVVRDVAILGVGGTSRLYVGTDNGQMRLANRNLPAGLTLKRLNWREVPTAN